jgi:hypothetical protein
MSSRNLIRATIDHGDSLVICANCADTISEDYAELPDCRFWSDGGASCTLLRDPLAMCAGRARFVPMPELLEECRVEVP